MQLRKNAPARVVLAIKDAFPSSLCVKYEE